MYILTQYGEYINRDFIERIKVKEEYGAWCVEGHTSAGVGSHFSVGRYETEEEAMKVVNEIIDAV